MTFSEARRRGVSLVSYLSSVVNVFCQLEGLKRKSFLKITYCSFLLFEFFLASVVLFLFLFSVLLVSFVCFLVFLFIG